MPNNFEKSEEIPNINQRLATLLNFCRGQYLRIGVRGSRKYLEIFINYFHERFFTVMETKIDQLGNSFPVPQEVLPAGYVVVVDSTGDWDNHTMNKDIKTRNDLGISDQQNAVFISWSQNKNDVSGGGSEFDTTFIQT